MQTDRAGLTWGHQGIGRTQTHTSRLGVKGKPSECVRIRRIPLEFPPSATIHCGTLGAEQLIRLSRFSSVKPARKCFHSSSDLSWVCLQIPEDKRVSSYKMNVNPTVDQIIWTWENLVRNR